ncbi:MAG: adenylyltransferase/cytidyltransferase family protein [Candidatus Berkelbacteria bacterium]|nr:adenylyltransferase/cytidyltransferase family protein [Candidatus Berkelbacteria bacterium]
MKILTHGCFDLLHIGHIKYLEKARELGTFLIVTITADRYITKGKGRPLFHETLRKHALESLRCVDYVEIVNDLTAIPAIKQFKPDIYAKGKDYADNPDPTLELERQAVELIGGKLVIVDPGIQYSSTEIMTGRMLDTARVVTHVRQSQSR